MIRRRRILVLLIGCLIALSLSRVTPSVAGGPDGRPAQVVLDPTQPSGVPGLSGFGYLSPVTQAQPFTHMLLRWQADLPAQSAIAVEVRASVDGAIWTAWGAVAEDDGLWQPSDGPGVHWGAILYAGAGARFWQVRASFSPAPDGATPALQRIEVNTVDARFGPQRPAPAPALDALGKPGVVSRSAWGNPDGQGSQAPPDYAPVSHMVIHHTADSNSLVGGETSWANRVRAEWSFHTYSRGWGDVGYNYLIDPNGVIYEGRAGGDNAVGFHDTANYGSMGVSLLGTYSSVAPTQASQSSLADLLAWKADQQQIDPLGSAYYYGCAYSTYCAPFNPGAVVATIAGHRQVTPGHTTCPGDSFQSLLPSIRLSVQSRLSGAPIQSLELLNVQYDRTTVAAGELLKVTFTLRNGGSQLIETQAPQAGGFNLGDSYAYDEDECFLGAVGQSYPAYPKEANRFRVTLGVVEAARAPTCSGDSGGYPWRWGLNGSLAPGETRQVVGYLRFRDPGSVTLRAGAIKEYVSYVTRDVFAQTITVTGERGAPVPASYDALLRPLAQVYRLGSLPDNLLARTQNALSLVKGDLVGSFAWGGAMTSWGAGGPLPGLSDNFIIEQSRVFVAPTLGVYTFQTTSDDGSWLWVDGTPVVVNAGLHATGSASGAISLAAGRHVLSFKYFERGGDATAGYSLKPPGASGFGGLSDGLSGSGTATDMSLGGIFQRLGGITVAADDQGGSGVAKLRVSFDGVQWTDVPGQFFSLGSIADGSYSLRYKALDAEGNESPLQTLSFRVDSTLEVWRVYLPAVVGP
ncbi:MAG: N-acetylmuramoyl-L-alanine amidase [Oscillochloris sp.]|nr:N-acetylmuramoyl-L-alanine amidase [Oscillochloris sp.]